MSHQQDKPEVIRDDSHTNEPYPQGHYYEHSNSICAVFGCGRELGLQEKLLGNCCYMHNGGYTLRQQAPASIMRLREIVLRTDLELRRRLPSYSETESQSHL